jgi:sugar O-acyltransferase (sialic acid O-acetyltransferase NeuD family)
LAEPLHIAGSGTYAAEIAGWAADAGIVIEGLVELEDPDRVGTVIHGLPVVSLDPPPADGRAVLGRAGDRRGIWEPLAAAGWSPAGVVHPTAQIAATADVSPSATVGPMAVVGAESVVGEQAILSRGALVGHHVRIGDFATLNPGANVGGSAEIGAGAYLGMGAVVVNNTAVGAGATVAAGAVAVRDVPPEARVQGVPAALYSGG